MTPAGSPPTAAPARARSRALAAATAAGVVALDQATKSWALAALADGPVEVFWTLRLRLAFNSGAAFSLGQGATSWLTAGAVVVLLVLLGLARSVVGTRAAVALGLVAGGAVGNLVDRLVRDHDGAVVDFVDLRWWPVFNVADAAITVGAVLLVLTGGLQRAPGAGERQTEAGRAGQERRAP